MNNLSVAIVLVGTIVSMCIYLGLIEIAKSLCALCKSLLCLRICVDHHYIESEKEGEDEK